MRNTRRKWKIGISLLVVLSGSLGVGQVSGEAVPIHEATKWLYRMHHQVPL